MQIILLSYSRLVKVVEEYFSLKSMLSNWNSIIVTDNEKEYASNSGKTATAMYERVVAFEKNDFTTLVNNTDVMLSTLESAMHKTSGLICACESFPNILRGGEIESPVYWESLNAAPSLDILYLEDKYCKLSGFDGVISDNTDNVEECCENQTEEIGLLKDSLSNLKLISLNVDGYISEIEESITKELYTKELYAAMKLYVAGVKGLEALVVSYLSPLVDQKAKEFHLRGYDYIGESGVASNVVNIATATVNMGPYVYPNFDPKVLFDVAKKAGVKIADLWDYILHKHIPQDWSNQKLLVVLYLLSQGQSCSLLESYLHLKNNKKEISEVYETGDYIENQYAWGKVKYGTPMPFLDGSGNMAYQGCEIIAMINAYTAMGRNLSVDEVAELIEQFELRGGTLNGAFGTSPTVILEYLTLQGYETQVCQEEDYAEIQQIAETSDTLIVTVYNNEEDLFSMIHTVNIEKSVQADGTIEYVVHNAGDSSKLYSTIEEAIESVGDNGKTAVIQVIGVSEPTS